MIWHVRDVLDERLGGVAHLGELAVAGRSLDARDLALELGEPDVIRALTQPRRAVAPRRSPLRSVSSCRALPRAPLSRYVRDAIGEPRVAYTGV